MVSHWLGWIALLLFIVLLLKVVGRKAGNPENRSIMRRQHKVIGFMMLAVSCVHGLLMCGEQGSVWRFLSLNWGTAAFVVAMLVAAAYAGRRRLKGKWLKLHKFGSAALWVFVIAHVFSAIC